MLKRNHGLTMQTEHPFDQSGTFEIHVAGKLDKGWAECMTGMACSTQHGDRAGEWVTVLHGWLPDQAALNGIINALYTRQLALRYVAMLKSPDVPVEAAPCHEGDKL